MSAKSLPVAVAQFTVAEEPERNLEIIDGFARDAAAGGAKLLVLPEGLIARRGDDDSYAAAHAQPLDGPFVDGLRRISAQRHICADGYRACCAGSERVGIRYFGIDEGYGLARLQYVPRDSRW